MPAYFSGNIDDFLNQWNASGKPQSLGAGYDVNPAPRGGQGAFGLVPGPVSLPSPARDLAAQLPGLSQANQAAADVLLAKLGGRLSPGTLKQMQDYEAQFAARSGMPGANAIPGTLSYNRGVRDIGRMAEEQAQQGLQDYGNLVSAVSSTQTVPPALQAEIAARNAQVGAAPDPFQAQSHAEQLYNQYLQQMRGPAGGTRDARSLFPDVFNPRPGAGTITPDAPTVPRGTPPPVPGQPGYVPKGRTGFPSSDAYESPYAEYDQYGEIIPPYEGTYPVVGPDSSAWTGWNDAPTGTTTTPWQSTYDPYAEFSPFDFGG